MSETDLKSKTARGLLWGGLGSGVQQFISLVFGIVLARLLDPSDYGMVGMLAIFTALATSLEEGGLKAALVNRKEIDPNDYNAVFWFNTLVSIALYFVLFFLAPVIASFFHTPELVPLARVVFLGFIFAGIGTAPLGYLYKTIMVREQAYSNVIASVGAGIVGVVLAVKGMGYWSLAIQSIAFPAIRTVFIYVFTPWRPTLKINLAPVWEMFGFSFRLVITSIFNTLSSNYFSVLFGRFYSKSDVGYYTQANKWCMMGYTLINGMVSSVSQPMFASMNDSDERQLNAFRKLIRLTAFISFPAMFGLALVAPEFITLTITEKWMPCVSMLRLLCVWGAFYPIMNVMSALVVSRGGSKAYMWINVTLSSLLILLLVLLRKQRIMVMLSAYVAMNILWLLVWHRKVRGYIGYRLISFVADLAKYLVAAVIVVGIIWAVTSSIENLLLLLIVRILTAVLLYGVGMRLIDASTYGEVRNFIFKKKICRQ